MAPTSRDGTALATVPGQLSGWRAPLPRPTRVVAAQLTRMP
ncbi:hypothetical protein [Streptomyces sp. NPDC101165]